MFSKAHALSFFALIVMYIPATIVLCQTENHNMARIRALLTGAMAGFQLRDHPISLPDFPFHDLTGRRITLSEFKGRVVLVNVWATWCIPCEKEMPSLDRLQAQFDARDFVVLAVSQDRGGSKLIKPFLDRLRVRLLTPYIDSVGRARRVLRSVFLPTSVLIDRKGREIGRLVGATDWDSPQTVSLIKYFLFHPSTDAPNR